jgi:uncharacterized protein YfaQ (DUF2300 family)
MTRKQLIRKLLKQAEAMIQGSLSQATRTCGTASCGCHTDPSRRHGPHSYLTFRTAEGKSSGMYVAPEQLEQVEQGRQAWEQFWETAQTVAALNREELKESWRAGRKGQVRR